METSESNRVGHIYIFNCYDKIQVMYDMTRFYPLHDFTFIL